MARIPMKGDPPSLQQTLEKYGDPADALAKIHFDCVSQAEQHQAAGEKQEAEEARKLAETCRKQMALYGFMPEVINGIPRAVRQN